LTDPENFLAVEQFFLCRRQSSFLGYPSF
jgi:hypothetical protein